MHELSITITPSLILVVESCALFDTEGTVREHDDEQDPDDLLGQDGQHEGNRDDCQHQDDEPDRELVKVQ